MRISILFLSALLALPVSAGAQEKTAEKLVASMQQADMTYRELMEVMGKSSSIMHEGIIRQNKQMVKLGANFIFTHPAPKHKPWEIMEEADQGAFKQSLVTFDEILDIHTNNIVKAAKEENWTGASMAAHELMNSCIACHAIWKHKVK
jgi:hypothetical protein